MNRKSMAQEYFILTTDENGNMPVMHKYESDSGLVAASVMDLMLKGVLTLEKKKIIITKEMPEELEHLASLYKYLSEKPRTTEKLMSDYVETTSRRTQQLKTEIGESLCSDQTVIRGKGGLFGNKTIYIPEKIRKEELAGLIRSTLENEEESVYQDMLLLYILKETKNLSQYLSGEEQKVLKTRLKEIQNNPETKPLSDMLNYIRDLSTLAMVWMAAILH